MKLALLAAMQMAVIGVSARAETPSPGPASSAAVAAQPATPSDASRTTAPPEAAKPCCVISAGTLVSLEIGQTLSTKGSQTGDTFKLRLTAPIVINGVTVAPVGAAGVGEVIDSRPGAMGGGPGKLILAARYLDVDGVRIPLQSLKLGGSGADNTGSAVMAAALVSPLLMLAVKGGDLTYPEGMPARAKVASDVQIPPTAAAQPDPSTGAPQAPPPAAPAPNDSSPASKGSTP